MEESVADMNPSKKAMCYLVWSHGNRVARRLRTVRFVGLGSRPFVYSDILFRSEIDIFGRNDKISDLNILLEKIL